MSYLIWGIVLICVMALAALFFSVNNISLRTFSSAKLNETFKLYGREERADKLIDNSEKLILACSFYRIVLNACILLLLVWLFSGADRQALGFGRYLAALIIAAAVFSVFGLAIPHAWAKYAGEKILYRSYAVLMFFGFIFWPFQHIFQLYDGLIKRLTGVGDSTPDQLQEEKEEEFLTDLEQQRLEGVVDAEEQQMIENVLDLTDTTTGEILTPRTDVIAIEANSDLHTVLDIITKTGHSRYPVFEQSIDKVIGLVYAKDLLAEIGKEAEDFKLSAMLRETYFVPETKPLRELLHEFQNQKLHIAVVLDEFGGTAGIVTLEDIIEELVGEITDEYEKTPPKPIRRIDTDTIEVDARTYVDDLNDKFELNLPEDEDYDTVGGFVFSYLGYIPKTGAEFDYGNLSFNIIQAESRKIKRIQIRKIARQ